MKSRRNLLSMVGILTLTFMLTGCSFQMPVIVSNETNVLEHTKTVLDDISDIKVSMQGKVVYGKDNSGVLCEYQGSVRGSVDSVLYSDMIITQKDLVSDDTFSWSVSSELSDSIQVSEDALQSQKQWYFDVETDSYYEKSTESKWTGYSNGSSIVDVNWWLTQLDNTSFKYENETKDSQGNKAYLLDAIYSGDDITALIQHLGLPMSVSADTSDMYLNLYVDRWTGLPTELQITLSDTGSQIMVSTDTGLCALSTFQFQLLFDMKSDVVTIPDDVLDLELQQPDNNLMMTGSNVMKKDSGLFLSGFFVDVEANDLFDVIDYGDNQIDVSSSSTLDGQPVMVVSLFENENAYVRAVSDRNSVWDFYESQGLQELYVSKNVKQFVVSGFVAYTYHTQYTEMEYGYVCQEYYVYLELSDDIFVKIIVRSITDQGSTTVLTDSYVNTMLSQIKIGKEGGE